ncbi:energy-coupling factor transporter transmembrane component T family protein [Garciella nitratireducens]|uniref:Energy-coupling factor transporter transmembrane protein EcfT n=1 Tax=Garciella nitratireducens DSM 15102 TaxID=1121911 RepID=A0A1T4PSE4_9FIRM|nr:energy-coupling factor transporter transmembrane component T [Garciella nitratireducens]RBP44912.1 energy-coupling factor transport system permease protein [Garciella nitratireducens]SJZ93808.1 energy-coupling factor transport system permease protein [Garciella nitratireducens DSM 15102]
MLKDITIGQYYPENSIIHRLDPRTKILLTIIYIISLFLINEFSGYIYIFVFIILTTYLSKVPAKYLLKGLKPLAVIISITVLINLFLTPGHIIFQFGFLKITKEGIKLSGFMALRLMFLVVGTSLLTYTTTPISLTDGIESIVKFIPFIKKYAHELAMMMSIALRFIPTLTEETDKIMKAQMARGADFESGNILQRAKSLVPLLVPLFISAFRRADDLAIAMEARCYRGGENRTRLKELKMSPRDFFAFGVMLILILCILIHPYLMEMI